jgi:glyoxylase-like metal-dependent hydrolase (beta-lactamase superfamily II)
LKKKFNITRIIVSHAHFDHFSGLNRIGNALGLKIILTKDIARKIRDELSYHKSYQIDDYKDNLKLKKNVIRRIWTIIRNIGENIVYKWIFGLTYINKPDKIIDSNSKIMINGERWRIFKSPGHSPEHISLYNKQKGILFSGDNVLKMRSTWLGPPESNIDEYLKSIRKYQNLPNLELILPAHGDIITMPKKILAAIIERMKEREDQLLSAIKRHSDIGLSPKDLIKIIYPNGIKFTKIIARDWIVITLKSMETKGLIERRIINRKLLFFPQG